MTPPVVRDHAIAALPEEQHLPVPVVRGQRPTVREHDWLSRAPVLVVNLCSVFRRDSRHKTLSFCRVNPESGIPGHRRFATGPE